MVVRVLWFFFEMVLIETKDVPTFWVLVDWIAGASIKKNWDGTARLRIDVGFHMVVLY